jgi:ABC-2 type transport system permease protein
MFKTITLKTLFGLRWPLVGWTLGVMSIALITMVLFDSFNQTGIDSIVESVPAELQSLIGSVDDFVTIPGYIGQQIFGPNLYIILIVMSIMLFLSVSAREEEFGGLQSLLTLPVSRTQVYFEKLIAVLFIILVVTASIVLALWIALDTIDKIADYTRIWQSVFDLYLISVAYGLIAYTVAMGTGKKALAILLAAGYATASFLISTLAPAVDKLELVDKFSLLHYYNSPQIMSNGLNWMHVSVLLVACTLLVILGWIGFIKRDVRAN